MSRAQKVSWARIGTVGVLALLGIIAIFAYQTIGNESVTVLDDNNDRRLLVGEVTWHVEYPKPANPNEWGDKEKDFTRLATTYYHRYGPLGYVFERYNWFPGPLNTYAADVRTPTTLVGSLAHPVGGVPMETLEQLWSEPPIGVVFLTAASVASYARPYQAIDFYEYNSDVIDFFAPNGPRRMFQVLQDAHDRGANVGTIAGNELDSLSKGPQGFYRVLVVETGRSTQYFSRYIRRHVSPHALEVFSKAVAKDGIICFHTSNFYHDVAEDVRQVAKRSGWPTIVGMDGTRDDFRHWPSQWVVAARRAEDLRFLAGPPPEWFPQPKGKRRRQVEFWPNEPRN